MGRAAGAITSNLAGTHVTYGNAAARHLFEEDSTSSLVPNALQRVMEGPRARRLRFKAEPDEAVEGFIADELLNFAPSAVSLGGDAVASGGEPDADAGGRDGSARNQQPQFVDNAKLVPILWEALRELATETHQLKATVEQLRAQVGQK